MTYFFKTSGIVCENAWDFSTKVLNVAIKFFRLSHLENSLLDVGLPRVSSKSRLITLTLRITVDSWRVILEFVVFCRSTSYRGQDF